MGEFTVGVGAPPALLLLAVALRRHENRDVGELQRHDCAELLVGINDTCDKRGDMAG